MSPLDEPCDPCGDVSYGVVGVLLAVMLGGSALALLAARLLW
jgi:hypothetical protein